MDDRQRRRRIAALLAVHVVVWTTIFAISANYNWVNIPELIRGIAWGFIFGETWLIGSWVGLSTYGLRLRLIGLLCGLIWLGAIILPFYRPLERKLVLEVMGIVLTTMLAIAFSGALFRRIMTKFDRRDRSSKQGTTRGQFSLKSLLWVVSIVAAILGGKGLFEEIGFQFPIKEGVTDLISGVLSMNLLVWTILGQEYLRVWLPITLVAVLLIGLITPYYMGIGGYLISVILSTVSATFTSLSLLVIRSCGYRLVRLSTNQPDPAVVEIGA